MAQSVLQRFQFPGKLPWLSKSSSVVGIDFGISSIKVVQLRRDRERAVLETYGEISTAPYTKVEAGRAVELNEAQATGALGDLLREAKVTTKRAMISIPLRKSFLTTIEMPAISKFELKQAVPFEARKYIPISMNDVLLDWRILAQPDLTSQLKADIAKKKDVVTILLAAVYKEVADRYNSIVRSVGLDPEGFEIESFSLARAVLQHGAGPVLLFDFGASSVNMMIAEFGVVRTAHSLDHGSQEITFALSKALGVSFERAEALKRQKGLTDEPEYQEALSVITPLIDPMIAEADSFVASYRRMHGRGITKVVLSGSGSLLKGFMDYMIKKFGVEAEMASPFNKVSYPSILQPLLRDIGPSFSVATGLALSVLSK